MTEEKTPHNRYEEQGGQPTNPLPNLMGPLPALSVAAALFLSASSIPLHAGSGKVNKDGTIDLTVNLRFPPIGNQIQEIKDEMTAASRVFWDASEGQLRLGQITLTCGSVNEDQGDIWLYPDRFRSGCAWEINAKRMQMRGHRINQSWPGTLDWARHPQRPAPGALTAHELGHYVLALGDEYAGDGQGVCIETGDIDETHHCIMQQNPATASEFCVASNHDPIKANGQSTGHTQLMQQALGKNLSCWEQMTRLYKFLRKPIDLPNPMPPRGFQPPVFVDKCQASNTVLLVLDRSGSMGDVIGPGFKDRRLEFLQGAARGWLDLAVDTGVRAGIVSFSDSGRLDHAIVDVDNSTISNLKGAVDSLIPAGNTGIGSTLLQTAFLFDAEVGANKTAFLISDGENNNGPKPADAAKDLENRGVRVFTIATGPASDHKTLSEVAGFTRGIHVDSRDPSTLVNAFAEQWAQYQNTGVLISREPYDLTNERPILLPIEEGTREASLIFAGNLSDMSGFGLRALLRQPNGNVLDTASPTQGMRVVNDRYYLLIKIDDPISGTWEIDLLSANGALAQQQDHYTFITDNPDADFFTSLDRNVVAERNGSIELSATPSYFTTLHEAEITVNLKSPDGSVTSHSIPESVSGHYFTDLGPLRQPGLYEAEVVLQSNTDSFNDPGEPIFTAPPATVPVPLLTRTSKEYFMVVPPSCPDLNIDRQADTLRLWWVEGPDNPRIEGATSLEGPWDAIQSPISCNEGICELFVNSNESHDFYRIACHRRRCVEVNTMDHGLRPNPWTNEEINFSSTNDVGEVFNEFRVDQFDDYVGLTTGTRLEIRFPEPCEFIELDLISFTFPSVIRAFSADGVLIAEEQYQDVSEPRTIEMEGNTVPIARVTIENPGEDSALLRVCCVEPRETSRNIVGAVEITINAGISLVSNPLNHPVDNTLNSLFPSDELDVGTIVYKYDDEAKVYLQSTNLGSTIGWSPELHLHPGEGAVVQSGQSRSVTLVGEVPPGELELPIRNGFSVVSALQPRNGELSELGFPAKLGDIVYKWVNAPSGGSYQPSVFLGDEIGFVPEASIAVGESFWIHKDSTGGWKLPE